jgi:dihydroxy-acid dehydratase
MLRAIGMTDDDWDKPQVGVASSWNEVTPCNLPLDRLAKQAKLGVRDAGGFPIEFTPSRCPTASRWATRACAPRW